MKWYDYESESESCLASAYRLIGLIDRFDSTTSKEVGLATLFESSFPT